MSSSEESNCEDESGEKSSEKGQDPLGKKRRFSKGERQKRRKGRQKLPRHPLNLLAKQRSSGKWSTTTRTCKVVVHGEVTKEKEEGKEGVYPT